MIHEYFRYHESAEQIVIILMNKHYLIKRELFILNKESHIKDQYQFIKEIGKGAYGKVFVAKLKIFPHYLRAVKVIAKKNIRNPTVVLNQIRIMGRLDHSHIIKLYQTFEDEKNLFLVIDYCSGNQLYDRLSKCQLFNQQIARHIFKQMVSAVKYLHSQRVCHRDLKLQNFLMEKEATWEIRVIDFGLSFIWNQNMREEMALKEEKKLIGTTYYMSPQVLSFTYDEKCDIWSLGVILYMMVTGTPPFDGEKEIEIMENIKKLNYSLKTPECQHLSPLLLDLISRMLKPQNMRISLDQITSHPWLSGDTLINETPLKLQFSKLKHFCRYSKLKKIVATYISTNLSQCEMQQMRNIFQKIDNNKDGYLTFEQFRKYFENQKFIDVPLDDIENFLNSVDMDHNGMVNYNQFLTSCLDESMLNSVEYMRYVFNSFDLNRDGKIQKEQFNKILRSYSQEFRCNIALVQQLLRENDKDKDGAIDFEEFAQSIKYIQQINSQNK